ncbi:MULTISPECIES: hypothetical protein [unclassified Rhizobium]|uniref:hypothetical protein n=1 Tax=unclassified Rhizobium TaxID=2613769 RepID=UPI001AD99F6A|nr:MULTISPECIES: hypothetical protein [unclassified Rhizobium]MBO9127802.1 hypothetical protein [Rhizobium sp. 16-488-2b]MBO9178264.1 hypothetical protein [Rhizobium sp. 16-488-2a]
MTKITTIAMTMDRGARSEDLVAVERATCFEFVATYRNGQRRAFTVKPFGSASLVDLLYANWLNRRSR